MTYFEQEINSWSEYEELISPLLTKGPEGPYLFRGQCNAKWKLISSLARKLNDLKIKNEKEAIYLEEKILRHFRKNSVIFHEDAKKITRSDILNWWELMQHYGAPTRLIDWTTSPYIALYFAVSDNYNTDGAVYSMDIAHVNWIQSSRNGDLSLKNSAAFKEIEKAILGVKHEDSIITIGSPMPTQRMVAQNSNLLAASKILIDYKTFIDNIVFKNVSNKKSNHSVFKKYIIKKSIKKEILNKLFYMNISPASLFPGLDGLGKGTAEYLLLSKEWEF